MKIGYARISTKDQNVELQKEALSKVDCEKIYEDVLSGAKHERPGLNLALEVLRSGGYFNCMETRSAGKKCKTVG